MPLSISVTVPTLSWRARIASSRYGTSSRLTIKPELSFAAIGCLPSEVTNPIAHSTVSWLVVMVRTTSTSLMSGTGLKKCRPMNRSARCVTAAMAAIVKLDVLEAKTASDPQRLSNSVQSAFLTSRSSVTASMMMSLSFRLSSSVVNESRSRVAPRSSEVIFAFSTALSRDFTIAALPFSLNSSDTSRTTVW